MKNIISYEKKTCWLNSAFPFILYPWIRVHGRTQMNADPNEKQGLLLFRHLCILIRNAMMTQALLLFRHSCISIRNALMTKGEDARIHCEILSSGSVIKIHKLPQVKNVLRLIRDMYYAKYYCGEGGGVQSQRWGGRGDE